MQEVTVKLPSGGNRSYTIYIGSDLIRRLGSVVDIGRYTKVLVVTDKTAGSLLFDELAASLPADTVSLELVSGERYKDIESVQRIWTALQGANCDRKSLVINLGGGVIGDLGGFAAATYMRGIDFLNVPTTLLAQVDAGVGGKTGFNFNGVKNLIGTFDQPIAIIVDTGTLKTLPKREFAAGFAEIIKHGAIADKDYFATVTAKAPEEFSPEELTDIIAESCRIKAAVVHADETENDQRKLLNFGHTVGHAVEALSLETDKPLLHGEAVSIGMAAEARISHAQGLLSADELERLLQGLAAAGLPVNLPSGPAENLSIDAIIEKMRSDKKNDAGKLNFTLLERIGQARYDQQVPAALIAEVMQTLKPTTKR